MGAGPEYFAVVQQIERLKAERRKGRIASAKSDHDELSCGRADIDEPIRTGERREEADDE